MKNKYKCLFSDYKQLLRQSSLFLKILFFGQLANKILSCRCFFTSRCTVCIKATWTVSHHDAAWTIQKERKNINIHWETKRILLKYLRRVYPSDLLLSSSGKTIESYAIFYAVYIWCSSRKGGMAVLLLLSVEVFTKTISSMVFLCCFPVSAAEWFLFCWCGFLPAYPVSRPIHWLLKNIAFLLPQSQLLLPGL